MQAAYLVTGAVAETKEEDWTRRFDDIIETPDGRRIKTLDDARAYLVTFPIPRNPEKRQLLALALRNVMRAAQGLDLMMHARIAVGRWVHRDAPPKAFTSGKDPHWGKHKLKRDR